jgi:hypothetical protein
METIKIERYTCVSYGVEKHKDGKLLLVGDVIKTLKHILDDEELIQERVEAFLEELVGGESDGKSKI